VPAFSESDVDHPARWEVKRLNFGKVKRLTARLPRVTESASADSPTSTVLTHVI
jgi:hypothetical protein